MSYATPKINGVSVFALVDPEDLDGDTRAFKLVPVLVLDVEGEPPEPQVATVLDGDGTRHRVRAGLLIER